MLSLLSLFLSGAFAFRPDLRASQLEANATVGGWAACGNEGSFCSTPYDISLFSFGETTNLFYEISSGYTGVGCNNGFFGDPSFGKGKACQVSKLDTTDKFLTWPTSWSRVASENGDYNVQNLAGGCTARWVRYGAAPNFFYKIMSGRFWCNNDWFGDPKFGSAKYCDVGNTCLKYGVREYCASEGNNCNMASSVTPYYLLQVEGSSTPKRGMLKLTSSPVVSCVNGRATHNDIDYGVAKTCWFYPSLPAGLTFGSPVGQWIEVASGSGVSMQLQEGVSRTDGKSVTSSFGAGLTTTLEAGYEFGGASVKASVSTNIWASESIAYNTEATQSLSKTCVATCPSNLYALFQWTITVPEACAFNNWGCNAQLMSCHFRCRATSSPPKCPYFKCCDEQCNTCMDYNGNCPAH